MHEEDQIGAVLKGYAEGFAGPQVRVDALVQLWDPTNSEDLSYLPAESNEPLLGMKALQEYYQLLADNYIITHGEVRNVRVRLLSGDLAYALCELVWKYEPKASPSIKLGFTSRASIVLRKRGGRWLYLQMHESVTFTPPPES